MGPEGGRGSEGSGNGIVTVELRFASMRQFQAELAPNLSSDGIFIPHADPFPPSTVVRFAVRLTDDFLLLDGVGVVLWSREEPLAVDQPAGMALRFASLGPRSQELIDSIVEAHVADGGRPFELDSVGEGDEFIPTDALAGRTVLPELRPLPSLRDRPVEDDTPRLKVRGVDADTRPRRPAAVGLEDEVTAVSSREVTEPQPAAAGPGSELGDPPPVSDAATEELWRDGLGSGEGPHGAGVSPEAGGAGEREDALGELRPERDLPLPGGPEQDEVGVTVEPEDAAPPRRPATRPAGAVELAREEGAPTAGPRDGVTAAELVAEVIADEELRSLRQSGEGAIPAESDEAVDVFADSLRTLDRPPASNNVGGMPEVTIVPRDEDEVEQATRKAPWGALAAVGLVLAVAVVGYLAREPIARVLVPDSPAEGPTAGDGVAGAPEVPTPTPTAVVSVPTPETAAVEPTAVLEPAPTAAPEPPPVEPTEVPRVPTAAPTPSRLTSGPAGRVEDIRWSADGARTVVTIVADGTLSEDRVRVGTMSDPPRVLVRVLRVDRFRKFELPVGTNELERIRIGHHPEQSPPSLHVVLDLTGAGVRLVSTEVEGAEVRLTLGR